MKHLLTISAIALTVPALAMAQAPAGDRQTEGQQQTQQPRAEQGEQQRAGQRASQKRLTELDQDHIKLDDLSGTSIVSRDDEEVGTVSDIVVDRQGQVVALVVTAGGVMGVGGDTKALAWDDVEVRVKGDEDDEYEVVVNMSEDEFEDLPGFEAERRTAAQSR